MRTTITSYAAFCLIGLFMFSSNLFIQTAQAQFPSKSNYKLPKGITEKDIEAGRVWFTLKPEYRNAFQSSNPLSRLINRTSTNYVKQVFPKTEHRRKLTKTQANKNISGVDISLIYQLNLDESVDVFSLIDELIATGMVEIAEPVPANKMYYIPNDTDIAEQQYLSRIRAYEAWDITKGDSTVLVGIVDSGFDFNHPDLKDKVYYNQNDPIDGIDNDNDGYIDNHYGWDFAGATIPDNFQLVQDNDPQLPRAGVDHGISVAGCAAAATDNNLGIAGTGFNVKLVNTKHSPDDVPQTLSIYDGYSGIVYMMETGVKIINCSWGGAFPSQIGAAIVKSAIEDYGCLIIVAAGNDGQNLAQFPASYDGVLSVGSTTARDEISSFTNYDYSVDILSPGSDIYTTAHSDANNGEYGATSGTSFSAPIVAGAAALVWSHRPELTPVQIGELMRITSDPLDDRFEPQYNGKVGRGRMNMLRALTEFPVAVRMKEFDLVRAEDGKIPYAGDVAVFNASFFSYLAASESDFQIKIESIDANSSILEGDIIYEGVMNTNQSITTQDQIRVQVSPTLENFGVVTLRITYTQDGYEAQEFASFVVNPAFITLDENNITTSVDSKGTIGRHEKITVGNGFLYKNTEMLYELGLMFSSDTKLSNTVRSIDDIYDEDFRVITPIVALPPDENEPEKSVWQTTFNDSGAAGSRLSINTTQSLQLWNVEGAEDFIVVEYVFQNMTSQDISNFYAGLYGDWDIGGGEESGNNQAIWKDNLNATIISAKDPNIPRVGVGVLDLFSTAGRYSLISNDPDFVGTPYGVYDGFTDQEKRRSLLGTSNTSIGVSTGTDVSATISAGPYTIPVGERIVIAFVLAAGDNDTVIEEAIIKANELYTPSIAVQEPQPVGIEYENELSRAIRVFPNPASNDINIDVSALNSNKPIEFTLLNILGQQILKTTLTKEQTTLKVDILPAGQYILRFNNGTTVGTKTLIIK
ncbi:S8/S53 family peptidase [Bernardetia sp. ABR2-2B]|uniref:S8/S53 family peptidase n=1 Tax=Bernardetia sp. ABR2-2B TaxID=3127472 RepID=UPI0030CCA3E4